MASPLPHPSISGQPMAFSGATFFWNALLFTRAVRAAGIETDPGGAIDYSRALSLVDIGDREQVRACGLALFVRRRDEVAVYDEVFRRFWDLHELTIDAIGVPDMSQPMTEGGSAEERRERTGQAGRRRARLRRRGSRAGRQRVRRGR